MHDDNFSYESGKIMKNDNTIINKADILELISKLFKSTLGRQGGVYATAGTYAAPDGKYIIAVIPTTDIILTTLGNIPVTAINLPQGIPVYGEYTSVTIAAGGTAYLYYGDV